MTSAINAVRSWQFWSDSWLLSVALFFLVAALMLAGCLMAMFDSKLHAYFEANGPWLIAGIHAVLWPLLCLSLYTGHRMSKAKECADAQAELVAREFEA